MFKLLKNWKYISFFTLITILLIYLFLADDIIASINGKGIKLSEMLQREITHFNIYDKYHDYIIIKLKIIPMIILGIVFLFVNFKNNLIKYTIGKKEVYNKEILKLKRKVALIPNIYLFIIMVIMLIITFINTKQIFTDNNSYFDLVFNKNDILYFITPIPIFRFIILELVTFISFYLLTELVLELVDRYGEINGILISGFVIWILPALFITNHPFFMHYNRYVPTGLMNSISLMSISITNVILPLIIQFVVVFWIRRLNIEKKEI